MLLVFIFIITIIISSYYTKKILKRLGIDDEDPTLSYFQIRTIYEINRYLEDKNKWDIYINTPLPWCSYITMEKDECCFTIKVKLGGRYLTRKLLSQTLIDDTKSDYKYIVKEMLKDNKLRKSTLMRMKRK